MSSVVDDHLLLDLLGGNARGWLAEQASSAAIYTTTSWYLPEDEQRTVRARLASLPDTYGLIGPRTLVPVMARLRTPRALNLLSAEALALALLTESSIAVRTDSPPLNQACLALHVEYRVVDG